MVASTITLPNVKRMFIPDPGYTFYDIDLAQADAQVVAWEADDQELKDIFADPDRDLHDENCLTIFGDLNPDLRHKAKGGVHATNYLVKPPKLAQVLNISVHDARRFQDRWFEAHPGIKHWHERIWDQLCETRSVSNKFGAKITFYDRITEDLLKDALAWIPQSTVGIVINKGILNVHNNMPLIQQLLQVHDSAAGQYPTDQETDKLLLDLKKNHEIVVPYDDPLTIGVGLATSTKSWGDCKKRPWPEAA